MDKQVKNSLWSIGSGYTIWFETSRPRRLYCSRQLIRDHAQTLEIPREPARVMAKRLKQHIFFLSFDLQVYLLLRFFCTTNSKTPIQT
jgi:hypothetical protein